MPRKAKKGAGSSLACLLGLGMLAVLALGFPDADGTEGAVSQVVMVVDSRGTELTSATVDQMVFLSSTYNYHGDTNQLSVMIIEVRDSNDVTVFLQFQTGTLKPIGPNNIAISWVPMERGSYVIRSFAITSFREPLILSDIVTNTFDVNRENAPDYSKLPVMSMSVQPPANDGEVIFEWDGVLGSYCWGDVNIVCADTDFIVPEELIEIKKGSTIKFQITNNTQPEELGVIVYKAENILAEQQLTTLDSGRYQVDLQSGNEYILFVGASWKDGESSAGSAVYYYKIQVK